MGRMASDGAFQRLLADITESEVEGVYRLSAKFEKELLNLPSCIGTAAVMLRRSIFNEVGDFDTTKQPSEDVDMWYRSQRHRSVGDGVGHVRCARHGAFGRARFAAAGRAGKND